MTTLLPERERLASLAGVLKVDDLLWGTLLEPLERFLKAPGKNLRARLVEAAFRLARPEGQDPTGDAALHAACGIIEALHAGALIIDDIEDGSPYRRNVPSLHVSHGVPIALNAGNWLYFWALHEIGTMGLTPVAEREVMRSCHEILLQAHFGQAIDVGVKIDEVARERVLDTCLASIQLKTGALTGLAMRLGGAAAGGEPALLSRLEASGRAFGTALQLHEDIGNFLSAPDSPYCRQKRLEDLRLKRPSWVWAVAAERFPEGYAEFVEAARKLPEESALLAWVANRDFARAARAEAKLVLERAREMAVTGFGGTHPETTQSLVGLIASLEKAYG